MSGLVLDCLRTEEWYYIYNIHIITEFKKVLIIIKSYYVINSLWKIFLNLNFLERRNSHFRKMRFS